MPSLKSSAKLIHALVTSLPPPWPGVSPSLDSLTLWLIYITSFPAALSHLGSVPSQATSPPWTKETLQGDILPSEQAAGKGDINLCENDESKLETDCLLLTFLPSFIPSHSIIVLLPLTHSFIHSHQEYCMQLFTCWHIVHDSDN